MARASRLTIIRMMVILFLGFLLAIVVLVAAGTASADTTKTNIAQVIQPRADCALGWTTRNNRPDYAYGRCYVPAGQQVRIRADCAFYPDRYSTWKSGRGTRDFKTGSCPVVRRAIQEVRFT